MHRFSDPKLAGMAKVAHRLDARMMAPALVAGTHAPGDWIPATTPSNLGTGTVTAGTPIQNLQGYHALATFGLVVSTATAATITIGVAPTSAGATAAALTVINTFTLASVNWNQVSAYVPAGYFVVINTTGTITVTSITGMWYPS